MTLIPSTLKWKKQRADCVFYTATLRPQLTPLSASFPAEDDLEKPARCTTSQPCHIFASYLTQASQRAQAVTSLKDFNVAICAESKSESLTLSCKLKV